MMQPIDYNNDDTRPQDRADLALHIAVEYLRLANEEVKKAMKMRAELTMSLCLTPGHLLAVAQEIHQEIRDIR